MRGQKELSLGNVYNDKYPFLSVAQQYGMFEKIGREGVELKQLLTGSDEEIRFQRAVILGLCIHGIFQKTNGQITIDPAYQEVLLGKKGSLKHYLDMPEWFTIIQLAPTLFKKSQKSTISGETWQSIVGISANSLSKEVFPHIRSAHPELTSGRLNALDLGCGQMSVFRQLAMENPNLTVTGIDNNPDVLEFLSKTLEEENLTSQINVIDGDVIDVTNNLQPNYDVALTSHLGHWLSENQINQLFGQVNGLLKSGGYFLIYDDYFKADFKKASSRAEKESARKNAILTAQGVQIFTPGEMTQILKQTGFKKIKSKIIARRRILLNCFA